MERYQSRYQVLDIFQFFAVTNKWERVGLVGMPIALVATHSPFLQDESFFGGAVCHVLVDAFSDPFLQGGFP